MAGEARGANRYAEWIRQLPVAVRVLIGVTAAVVGVILIVNPFRSLGVLLIALTIAMILHGVAESIRSETALGAAFNAVVWSAAGVLLLVLPGLTIVGMVVVVGVSLVVSASAGIIRSVRGHVSNRAAELMLALASLMLGVLALVWPDVTVFVIAALFGVRMLAFGVDLVVGVFRQRQAREERPGWRRTVGAAAGLLGAGVLALVSVGLSGSPQPDSFYAAPDTVPEEPGQLLRAEPFTRTIPDGATAWRILHTTTAPDGTPALASALVVVPDGGGERDVVAWAHGTTGWATGCAPSLLEEPFVAGAMQDLAGTLANGWAVVATDYMGLGTDGVHPYLIGPGEAHSVLDSIRAARQLADANLGERTVVWGHSQGGHAALWTGGLAESYAPELDILGVVAMAPAANLPVVLDELANSVVGGVFGSFTLAVYSGTYDEIRARDYVRPGARITVQSMQQRCLTDPSTLVSLATSIFSDSPPWLGSSADGPLGERLEENVPTLLISVPLLLAQGGADTLISPAAQDAYVAERCAAGQSLDYRTYAGRDHMGLVADDSPLIADLHSWTADRFAGVEAANTCG